MNKFTLSLALAFMTAQIHAGTTDNLTLLPMPQSVKLTGSTYSPGGQPIVTTALVDSVAGAGQFQNEAYKLTITDKGIHAEATNDLGLYRAMQTLEQLGDNGTYPTVEISDWAAFPIRGFMMDVGRTYIPVDEIKREIDLLSKFKINVYHLHFTENQAWRLESKIYPQLNDSSVTTRMPGKFYTLDELRDIADYAAERKVLLIPEIDMPGHSAVFNRTFGLDMQSPEGMAILKDLITEACEAVPNLPYFHIGTDEVEFTNPDFVPEMVKHVRSLGKKAISWNPGWHYKPGEIDMLQMWSYRGKPEVPGVPTIDSRYHYINHFDTFADLVCLYRSNIYNQKDESEGDVKGSILAIWNDRYVSDPNEIVSQNGLYANMLALAERAWLGGGDEYFNKLGTNLVPEDSADFNRFVDFERRLLHHKATTLKDVPIPYEHQTNIRWRITDAFPNGGDLDMVFPPENSETALSYVYNDSVYNTKEAAGAGVYLRHVWGTSVPAFYSDPKPNHTAYAYTWVYSPDDREVGLNAEFQNYSRSESDIAPEQGKWDIKNSRIWINDKEILPPHWTSIHRTRDNEIPLGNENFSAREPIPVKLHKGWNKIMLKLPIGSFSSPEVRLVKWMFTVFLTPDDDLIYSPDRELTQSHSIK